MSYGTGTRNRRPNYAQLHARPLPLITTPLPAFIPHNPLSLIRILHALLLPYIAPPPSHPAPRYQAYFSPATRSVHVTDPAAVRALWESGFFGKGSLSRSEPTWLEGEKRRRGLGAEVTSEEVTAKRRRERVEFKRERARLEREAVEEQLRKEKIAANGGAVDELVEKVAALEVTEVNGSAQAGESPETVEDPVEVVVEASDLKAEAAADPETAPAPSVQDVDIHLVNQEHLQLSLEEAFFLTYALGVLDVQLPSSSSPTLPTNASYLHLFRTHSRFPPSATLTPTDPFLLRYAVYHHFRALGWVVRDGVKFASDFLLYERGPVFKHAAFAVMVLPSFTHEYWFEDPLGVKERRRVEGERGGRDWVWLHCVNRVQTAVVKTLVIAYVDVPPPGEEVDDVGDVLGRYKVREFCLSRWSPNRNRG
ncbi:hypothetical protein EJ06DRAFT_541731 [Trichodelitschia bisporula]|uniref:tRNA-splicing endonuclease subunit Sen2 n=1 Tax=Trichodelitschia bisporula TaxID=703511 RepID=A0A6G1I3R0_9PEZI|nr:hypothetical protein EJ06DRAFT_541731 [Trichodelitschia bisporula]